MPNSSFHLRELGAPMMGICELMEATCSERSLRPSNLSKEGGLKSSGTDALISRVRVVEGPIVPSPLRDWDLVGIV